MSRPETKQRIPHMLMDTDFYEKPENIEAVDKFGDIAPSAIQRICFKLMNENNARMKKSQVLAMWRSTGTDQEKWIEIIEYYINCNWLVEQDGYITSGRVEQERARVLKKRDTLSANAKQKHNKSTASDNQNESKSSDTVTDTDINKLRLLGKFNTPEIREAVSKWRDKQRKQGRNYDQIQLDANCINFSTPERFLKALNFSLGLSKTFNIHEPPEKETKNGFQPKASTPASESMHPSLRAEREREAKAALKNLGLEGLTK